MKYRQVKNIDEKISLLGAGTWSACAYNWTGASEAKAIRSIEIGLALGLNLIDTAPIYGYGRSEEVVAKVIKKQRSKIFLATKCGLRFEQKDGPARNDLSRASILWEIDQSLARLETDYIDLYQLHWPDPAISLEETLTTLNELVQLGKIRYIGLSNFSLEQIKEARKYAQISAWQGLYNLIDQNSDNYHGIELAYRTGSEILPYCQKHGIAILPYSPMAQGLLANTYSGNLIKADVRNSNPILQGENLARNLKRVEALAKLAKERNLTASDLALAWLASQEAVSSILVGIKDPEMMEANVKAVQLELDSDCLTALDKLFN